jgi:hypothetical protein
VKTGKYTWTQVAWNYDPPPIPPVMPHISETKINSVEYSGIPLFSDPRCTVRRDDVLGVVVRAFPFNHEAPYSRILPTRRTDLKRDARVTWEFGGHNHARQPDRPPTPD